MDADLGGDLTSLWPMDTTFLWVARAGDQGPEPSGLWLYVGGEVLHLDTTGLVARWRLVGAPCTAGSVLSSDPLVIQMGSRIYRFDRETIERRLGTGP